METVLLPAGVACMIAAVVGGGLTFLGITIPVISTLPRQVVLFLLGALFVFASVALKGPSPRTTPSIPRAEPAIPRVAPAAPARPAPEPRPARPKLQYKLIWVNHFEPGKYYEVVRTDVQRKEIRNDEFKQWCIPFDPNRWIIHESRLIAGDEHWKEDPTRLSRSPYNLPAMNERWFQIMDDEKWYLYTVEEKQ